MSALSGIARALAGIAGRPGAILLAILAAGFALRAIQTHVGLPYVYNFDDPQIASHALEILKTGDWNPHFFAYGSLMIYLDTIVDAANYLRLAGLPAGSPESLFGYDQIALIDGIVSPMDGSAVWYWTISHPSFYLWDRYVTVVFATGTIAVTYALARRFIPGRIALAPPFLLAILPFHIVQSGLTTTDIPVGFMVGVATLAAIAFAETGGLTAFVTSLIFVGLAAATKYNSGLILISPLLALGIRTMTKDAGMRWWHWLLLIFVPAVIFVAAMPFALLDFKHFITDLASAVSSYHMPGSREARPGIRHLRLILTQFAGNVGLVGSVIALVGAGLMVAATWTRRSLALVLAFPFVFILYMSTTTTDYHRNFDQLYPFICLYAGYGLFRIVQLRIVARAMNAPARAVATAAIVAAMALPLLYGAVINAAAVLEARDTRSLAVDKANALTGVDRLEILDALHIHSSDLARLGKPYSEADRHKIVEDMCSAPTGTVFILSTELKYTQFLPPTADQAASLESYNRLPNLLGQRPHAIMFHGPATPTWGPPVNPGVMVIDAPSGLCAKPQP